MKSNITIKSNIYIRNTNFISTDVNFVKNVQGLNALQKVKKYLSSNSRAKLTTEQLDFLKLGITCELAKDGQSTHGTVLKDGKIQFVCRCEYSQCNHFNTDCKPFIQPLSRIYEDTPTLEDNQYGLNIQSIDDSIGLNYENSSIFKDNVINQEETSSLEDIQMDISSNDYVLLDSKDNIIQSSIDSKILINAGAGTGKTYTVIQRLLYLLKNEPIQPMEILVICYTRSAKKVIEDRILNEVQCGNLPYSALGVCLFTLDSLATNYLVNFQDIDISSLDYNQRIQLFNKKVISENLDIFKYLIVDEIQDLVNDRAIMLLKILQCTSCGYMLLGDKCQAIYDYSCNDNVSISSLEFYKRLERYVNDDGLKYEFTKNMRQNDNLLELSAKLRSSMLNDTLQNQIATLNSIVSNLEVYESSVENINKDIIHGKTAILTRNNGEAEYIHTNLLKYKIPHNISRGTQGAVFINKNISTIFWDYCKNNISKKDFILRYRLRIEDDTQKAEDYFDILKSISNTDEDSTILSMDNLIKGLQIKNDLPIELLTPFNDNLTISTIHKAKGQEIDTIYLLENNGTLTDDEIRIKYVALTRAKNSIKILKKKFPEYWFFKSSKADSRTISCSNHYSNTFCSGVSFGLDNEIDQSSFVTCLDKKFNNPVEVQEYIVNNITVGDTVNLIKNDDIYYIYHNGTIIGRMSLNFNKSLRNSMQGVTYNYKLPIKISDVYISNIVTFVNTSHIDTDFPIYKKSRIFFGVELSGIGKTYFK